MAHAAEQSARTLTIGQAGVFFTDADLLRYIRKGVLEEREERLPYSPQAMEQLHKTWRYAQ